MRAKRKAKLRLRRLERMYESQWYYRVNKRIANMIRNSHKGIDQKVRVRAIDKAICRQSANDVRNNVPVVFDVPSITISMEVKGSDYET